MKTQKEIEDEIRYVTESIRAKMASLPAESKTDLETLLAQLSNLYQELSGSIEPGMKWMAVWPHGG